MKHKIVLLLQSVFYYCILAAQPGASIVGPGKQVDPFHLTTVKSATFGKACVASANPIASEVGAVIMKNGGNAFDAGIAVQFALAVVYPNAGNIGGGGFLVARKPDGTTVAIDYREMAPAAASRDMYLDNNGNPQNNLSENGHLSAGVPGTVAGIFATLPHARLRVNDLVQPAIDLAQHGFVLSKRQANELNEMGGLITEYSTAPTAFVRDRPWKEGDTLIQPELAATLTRIRDQGLKGFYEGETARLIVAEMARGRGIITYDDLKAYKAVERKAVEFDYRGHQIIGFPPPSSGGILLAQMLKMIEPYPIGSYGFQTPASVQLMTEAERRAYADRAEHMGDPDYWKVPLQQLTSDNYLAARMKDFTPGKASKSADIKAGVVKESEQTTHISIIDAAGNMVAITTTLNDSYGSKTVVGGAGFLLNDEMDDFSIKPGVPNMYGAVGGEANAIAPGKRMLSSMTPTLVLKDHQPFLVVGTPGGTTIPTSVFQSIVNVVDFGMNATDAVNKPKFHHQWLPDEIMAEKQFDANTKAALQKMGYTFRDRGAIGRTEMIRILANGQREVAADTRGDDSVAGF